MNKRPVRDLRNRFSEIIDKKLMEAETVAASTSVRYSHDEVFGKAREYLEKRS